MKKTFHQAISLGLILFVWLLAPVAVRAQQIFSTQTGFVSFFSDAPLEDIEAKNNKAQSLINTSTREVAVKVPIKGFVFPNGLMQEHFNENYLESDKYPFATFKGRINEEVDLAKEGTYDVSATGKFSLHGVEQEKTIKGKLQIVPGKMNLTTTFTIALADYKIEIPSVVFMKIAEQVAVTTKFEYTPFVKQ